MTHRLDGATIMVELTLDNLGCLKATLETQRAAAARSGAVEYEAQLADCLRAIMPAVDKVMGR